MALFDKKIDLSVPGLEAVRLPRMARVRQKLVSDRVKDVKREICDGIAALGLDLKGKKIAVTAGSRGIADYLEIMRSIVGKLKEMGSEPFLFPAMGSHGGATAEGQLELLERYGVTESSVGAPIRSSMETVEVGELPGGRKVYCDKYAWESDGIVVCNRVKPHTDFKGDWESGLLKMIAIGVGKHQGATSMHRAGFVNFHTLIPQVGEFFLAKRKVIFGVSSVENGHEQVMKIEVSPPQRIMARERELLKLARSSMARLPFDRFDVLVVDEIGKNISGSGMDPNVMGRTGMRGRFPGVSEIGFIVALGLSEETHGSAVGIGAADVTTRRLVDAIDLPATYVNHVTSGALSAAAIPMMAADDEEALRIASFCVPEAAGGVQMVHVRSTLMLEEFDVSENMLAAVRERPDVMTVISEPAPMQFAGGRLAPVLF